MTNKDEQIGFHKGALTTLAKEKEEFLKVLSIIDSLMQMHLKGLKELGIDLEKEAKQAFKNKKLDNIVIHEVKNDKDV
ncbi:hypothetical protein J4414_00590 [Candidatus Woesearchaeota archaeon]|nr:hypothetical protein [Candidatus Woesearchaeota archaeon]